MLNHPWLNDEPEILQLLYWFVKRFQSNPERSNPPGKTLKLNFLPPTERSDQSWALFNKLTPELLEFKANKKSNPYDPIWAQVRVTCPLDNKDKLFQLLEVKPETSLQDWQNDLAIFNKNIEASLWNLEHLKNNPIYYPDKTNVELLQTLRHLSQHTLTDNTLRELSARYFWGDSKYLDTRQDWLQTLLPQLSILNRKVQVNFYLPEHYQRVLFIENLDTYHQVINSQIPQTENSAIVYTAGYKTSAQRIRHENGVSLHQSIHSSGTTAHFIDWWFNKNINDLSCYFWGDCDFSAMGILKALRNSFDNMQCWQPGYQPMLQKIINQQGHAISLRNKKGQNDPTQTGCHYADENVLPVLRQYQQFYDQEGVDLNSTAPR